MTIYRAEKQERSSSMLFLIVPLALLALIGYGIVWTIKQLIK